jgi:hypothetical protein
VGKRSDNGHSGAWPRFSDFRVILDDVSLTCVAVRDQRLTGWVRIQSTDRVKTMLIYRAIREKKAATRGDQRGARYLPVSFAVSARFQPSLRHTVDWDPWEMG